MTLKPVAGNQKKVNEKILIESNNNYPKINAKQKSWRKIFRSDFKWG